MSTNQLIAMLFPLLAFAAVAATLVLVVKPWSQAARARRSPRLIDDAADRSRDRDVREALREAQVLLRKAEQRFPEAEAL